MARGAARATGSGQTRSVAQRPPTRGAPTTGSFAEERAFDVLASQPLLAVSPWEGLIMAAGTLSLISTEILAGVRESPQVAAGRQQGLNP